MSVLHAEELLHAKINTHLSLKGKGHLPAFGILVPAGKQDRSPIRTIRVNSGFDVISGNLDVRDCLMGVGNGIRNPEGPPACGLFEQE